MKKPSVLTLALAVLLASAVAAFAQDVRYNFDKQADFSQFKTYKWVTLKGGQVPNELVDTQIKAAVDMELATKGLKRTDAETADLYVGYQSAINTEKDTPRSTPVGAPGPAGMAAGGMAAAGEHHDRADQHDLRRADRG